MTYHNEYGSINNGYFARNMRAHTDSFMIKQIHTPMRTTVLPKIEPIKFEPIKFEPVKFEPIEIKPFKFNL